MAGMEPSSLERDDTATTEDSFGVLIVDDSEANRDVLSRRLRRRGYRVGMAANGNEALELLKEIRFDLILLDIMMPGLSGLEVLQIIRQKHGQAELPVIMATAKDDISDMVQALELGANDYVTKPLNFPIVLARVQTQLSLRGSVRQILALEQKLRHHNDQLEALNAQLQQAHDRMRLDLLAAARVQKALLPRPLRVPGYTFSWAFQPCAELAGDGLNVCRLDEDHVGLYVLDVSGHGVAAALLAVAVTRALSPGSGPDSLLLRANSANGPHVATPAEVAQSLNEHFPWDPGTEQYFTILYGVLNIRSGEIDFMSAAHPGPVYLPVDGPAHVLKAVGLPIGLGSVHEQHSLKLSPGDRFYVYSDGVIEAPNPTGEPFTAARLLDVLERSRVVPLEQSVGRLQEELAEWCCCSEFHDDVSVVAIEVG